MTKYVALLRGINVGGNNKVEMPRLKKAFESSGYKNVSTYINTGNVIFESDKKNPEILTQEIEKKLKSTFGFEIKTVIRDSKNIQKLCKMLPSNWENNTEQKTDVLFLWKDFDTEDTIKLIISNPQVDNLKYISSAIIWNLQRENYTKSGMKKFIGTKVYKNMTARNINTVRKLNDLMK